MKVLITGGAGYIGSHCNRYFNEQGIETVVVDDLSDGHEEAVVAGKFVKGDFGDAKLMKELFKKEKVDAVIKPFNKIKVPSHEIAMMMTIAIRFIPTLAEETDKIMKAQMARGADFETGNIIRRAKAMIPLLVPLFVNAFRRADELATAMEARCYNGGNNRTKMKETHMTKVDLGAIIVFVLAVALIMAVEFLIEI